MSIKNEVSSLAQVKIFNLLKIKFHKYTLAYKNLMMLERNK